jgi:hypothetical protein
MKLISSLLIVAWSSQFALPTSGFVAAHLPASGRGALPSTTTPASRSTTKSTTTAIGSTVDAATTDPNIIETPDCLIVKAPLKYISTYPCLSLRFPNLATSSQRSSGKSGVSLDFVLATATNVNTVANEVATALTLRSVGTALPDFGATTGQQAGGTTYTLGDVQLEGQTPLFMLGLTAAALPVTNPVAAGTLSMAFLQSFDAVDFGWGIVKDMEVLRRPSFTFYGGVVPPSATAGRTRVVMERFPGTQSPIVTILVNGVPITALLDTGSPISILLPEAADRAGVQPMKSPSPGAGEKFTVAGERGQLVDLIKSVEKVSVQAPSSTADDNGAAAVADFGAEHLFVGDIPSLAALGRVPGVTNAPMAVLGLDVLQRRPSMLLRAKINELWFE